MQNKKNQTSVGMMIQRCHKWRQKRKQYMDQARQTADEIERERLMQAAEHYGRIISEEQGKIDSSRDVKEKVAVADENIDSSETTEAEANTELSEQVENSENSDDDEETSFPDFITQINNN